ncbi:hypothetical protein BV898_04152 [Hypsibius exemplaris]|uniref:Gustatory receptor n=1 Tax=Hypsibius exemplaris TaxID=2072580 RepID=A0A1W0X365_HYPEX|nr:hypothetical protein BV898_04152 [Hypsibius exemplaris]
MWVKSQDRNLEDSKNSILPKSFILWMRLIGIFVYRIEDPPHASTYLNNNAGPNRVLQPSTSKVILFWCIWTLVMIAFAVVVLLADVELFLMSSSNLIARLEFFTLVLWVFRFITMATFPVILIIMLIMGRHLMPSLARVQENLTPSDFQRMQTFRICLLIWIAFVTVGLAVGTGWIIQIFLDFMTASGYKPSIYSIADFYPFTGISLLGECLIYIFYLPFSLLCFSTHEIIFFLFLYACKIRLGKLSEELGAILADYQRSTPPGGEPKAMNSQRIRAVNRKHTAMQGVVENVTALFGSTSLAVWSLRDVTGCLCLLALLFRRGPTKQTLEMDVIGTTTSESMYESSKPGLIVLAVFSVVHAVIRIVSCLGITDENNEIKKLLTRATTVGQVASDGNFAFECSDFLERLETEELHISPHGFYSISLEYGLSLVGLVVSYFLIMYQLQDQKVDMESLMSYREAEHVFQALQKNVSHYCMLA